MRARSFAVIFPAFVAAIAYYSKAQFALLLVLLDPLMLLWWPGLPVLFLLILWTVADDFLAKRWPAMAKTGRYPLGAGVGSVFTLLVGYLLLLMLGGTASEAIASLYPVWAPFFVFASVIGAALWSLFPEKSDDTNI